MISPTPLAAYDVLFVVSSLNKRLPEVTTAEVQVLTYLACLLSVYSGKPASDWGYDFAATPESAPFSEQVVLALENLRSAGYLSKTDQHYSVTASGKQEFEMWSMLARFQERSPYLHGSTGTTDALPVAAVANGVAQDPQFSSAVKLQSPRALLDDLGNSVLYEDFAVLESALGREISDLLVPAVVWITYLLDSEAPQESVPGGN